MPEFPRDKGNKVRTTVKKGGGSTVPSRADAPRRLSEPPVRIRRFPRWQARRRFVVRSLRCEGAVWPNARHFGPRRVPLLTGWRAHPVPASGRRAVSANGSWRLCQVRGRPPRGSPPSGDPSRQAVLPPVPLSNAAPVPFPVAAGPRRGTKRAYPGDSRAKQAGAGGAGATTSLWATVRICGPAGGLTRHRMRRPGRSAGLVAEVVLWRGGSSARTMKRDEAMSGRPHSRRMDPWVRDTQIVGIS